jgi:RHS repeat-associated protein
LTGLYASGATCSNKTGQVYASNYDSFGNVTSRTYSGATATLSYDLLDHFTSWNAWSRGKDLSIYDASGNRVLRRTTTSSSTTMTVYAFGLEEHTYLSSGGHTGDLYYYSLGGRLLGASDGSNSTFYLTDALGSLLARFSNTANSAVIKGNQVFGPYGNTRDPQGTINTAKGYTGQYNDSLTGLDYYGSRYYDQVAGVFLSADTAHGNESGANPYAYVGGNPETKNDPSGQMPCAGGGGPCSWGTKPPGRVTGGGASSNPWTGPLNAVGPTSNPAAAAAGYQPTCVAVGCVSQLGAKVGIQATINHFMNVNMPTIVCAVYCFITLGNGLLSEKP